MKKTVAAVVGLLVLLAAAVISSPTAQAQKARACECVEYTRFYTGFTIRGNGNQWDNNAKSYGYRVVSSPVVGGAINFEAGAYSAHSLYGHVGVVTSFSSDGNYWNIRVRHANWPSKGMFTHLGCNNVSDKDFRIKKNDPNVHYIIR